MNLTKFQRTSLLGVTLFLLVFSFSGCAPITSLRLDDPYMAKTDKIQYELMPSGNVVRSYTYTDSIKNITYTVGVSANDEIIYIGTRDPNFKMGGLTVGSPVGNYLNKGDLRYASGWAYFVPVKDGWYAGLDYKNQPTSDSPVLYFFQYRFGK